MTTAIGLACICAGIALVLAPWLVGRIGGWWAERQHDPKRHRGDFAQWRLELNDKRQRGVDHE